MLSKGAINFRKLIDFEGPGGYRPVPSHWASDLARSARGGGRERRVHRLQEPGLPVPVADDPQGAPSAFGRPEEAGAPQSTPTFQGQVSPVSTPIETGNYAFVPLHFWKMCTRLRRS